MIDFNIDEIDACCDSLIADGLEYLAPAGMNDSVKVKAFITRLRQAEKDAARYIFLRDEATDYHTGEIHGAREEDRDDLVDMFMEQLNEKVKQIERAKSKMIRKPIDEAMQCRK